MEERKQKLIELRDFLLSSEENINLAKHLSLHFLGESMGCGCKFSKTKSQLNQLWESQLKKELETYENN